MRVNYTDINRWNTFTKCECVGGDIVSIDWSVGVMLRYRTHRAIMT